MDRRQRKRALAIALAVLATGGLVVASFANKWLVSPDREGELSVGLRDVELCLSRVDCKSMTTSEVIDYINAEIERIHQYNQTVPPNRMLAVPREPWDGFPVVGWIAFVAALVAAGSLMIGVGLALAGK